MLRCSDGWNAHGYNSSLKNCAADSCLQVTVLNRGEVKGVRGRVLTSSKTIKQRRVCVELLAPERERKEVK